MSLDQVTINTLSESQKKVNEYWSAENSHNRLMEIAISQLTCENENLKKIVEKQKAEILALKKENRVLKGLPEEEPVVVEKVVEVEEENRIHRSFNGQRFLAAEEVPIEENLESFEFDEEFWDDEGFLQMMNDSDAFISQLNEVPIEEEVEEGEVDAVPIVRCKSAYPKFQSLFGEDSQFRALIDTSTSIRVGKLGDDSPLRYETPNPRRNSFNY